MTDQITRENKLRNLRAMLTVTPEPEIRQRIITEIAELENGTDPNANVRSDHDWRQDAHRRLNERMR